MRTWTWQTLQTPLLATFQSCTPAAWCMVSCIAQQKCMFTMVMRICTKPALRPCSAQWRIVGQPQAAARCEAAPLICTASGYNAAGQTGCTVNARLHDVRVTHHWLIRWTCMTPLVGSCRSDTTYFVSAPSHSASCHIAVHCVILLRRERSASSVEAYSSDARPGLNSGEQKWSKHMHTHRSNMD